MMLDPEFGTRCLRLCAGSRGLHAVGTHFRPLTLRIFAVARVPMDRKNIGHCPSSREARIIACTLLDVHCWRCPKLSVMGHLSGQNDTKSNGGRVIGEEVDIRRRDDEIEIEEQERNED